MANLQSEISRVVREVPVTTALLTRLRFTSGYEKQAADARAELHQVYTKLALLQAGMSAMLEMLLVCDGDMEQYGMMLGITFGAEVPGRDMAWLLGKDGEAGNGS